MEHLKGFHSQFLVLHDEDDDYRPSISSNSKRLRNKDLDPVPASERTWEWYHIAGFWISEGFSAAQMETASASVALGLNPGLAIVACMIGNFLVTIPICLNGYVGAKYGINFPVLIRSTFGIWGAIWPVIVRGVVCVIWFGIQTYLGAQGVEAMIQAIWPSFKTWHSNSLAPDANVTAAELLSFSVLWILTLPLLYVPTKSLRWIFLIKPAIMPIFGAVLFTWALTASNGLGPLFHETSKNTGGFTVGYAFLKTITASISGNATFALNMPDITRFAKKPRSVVCTQAVAVPIVITLTELLGAVLATSAQVVYGSLEWNPLLVVQQWDDARAAKFFGGLFFAFSMVLTNVAGNSIPFGNDLTNLFPKYINVRRGQFICAVLAFAITPWNLENSAEKFMDFLDGYTVFLGAIAGLMITDYWIIRRAKGISVSHLFLTKGLYWYNRGFNYRAFAGFIAAIAPLLPGLAYSMNDKVHVSKGIINFYSFNWVDAVVLGSVTYFLLSIIHPPSQQVEDSEVTVCFGYDPEEARGQKSLGIEKEEEA